MIGFGLGFAIRRSFQVIKELPHLQILKLLANRCRFQILQKSKEN